MIIVFEDCSINSINQLITQLREFLEYKELTCYRITESFNNCMETTYELYNINAEFFDRFVIFDDLEHNLQEDYSRVLNMFIIDQLININQSWDKNWQALLTFKDGTILIERV